MDALADEALISEASVSKRFHEAQPLKSLNFSVTRSRETPTFNHREFITDPGNKEEMAVRTSARPVMTKNIDLTAFMYLYLFPPEDPDRDGIDGYTPE